MFFNSVETKDSPTDNMQISWNMNMKCDELLMYVRNKTSIMFNFTVMYCHCYIQGPVALKFSYHEQNGYVNTFHRGRTESIKQMLSVE